MAQFTKVNSDYQPVINMDSPAYTNNGLNAVVSGAVVQPQGPKLDYFTITAASGTHFSTTQINVMVETIQQLATVYLYQYNSASTDTFSFACYPCGAWANVDPSISGGTPANVVSAINAALTAAQVANTTTGTEIASFTTLATY